MSASLVGSEMCIRDRPSAWWATMAGQRLSSYSVSRAVATAMSSVEQVSFRARPSDVGQRLSARWGYGVWLWRRWGAASRIVAVSPRE
eukprot:3697617-Alexandrium_andersonii.AAC.1